MAMEPAEERAGSAMRAVFEGVDHGNPPSNEERQRARRILERLIAERALVRKFRGEGGRPIGRLVRRVDDPLLGDFVGVLRTLSGAEVYVDVRNLAYVEDAREAEPQPVHSA